VPSAKGTTGIDGDEGAADGADGAAEAAGELGEGAVDAVGPGADPDDGVAETGDAGADWKPGTDAAGAMAADVEGPWTPLPDAKNGNEGSEPNDDRVPMGMPHSVALSPSSAITRVHSPAGVARAAFRPHACLGE
jgi:hypothetical protein